MAIRATNRVFIAAKVMFTVDGARMCWDARISDQQAIFAPNIADFPVNFFPELPLGQPSLVIGAVECRASRSGINDGIAVGDGIGSAPLKEISSAWRLDGEGVQRDKHLQNSITYKPDSPASAYSLSSVGISRPFPMFPFGRMVRLIRTLQKAPVIVTGELSIVREGA